MNFFWAAKKPKEKVKLTEEQLNKIRSLNAWFSSENPDRNFPADSDNTFNVILQNLPYPLSVIETFNEILSLLTSLTETLEKYSATASLEDKRVQFGDFPKNEILNKLKKLKNAFAILGINIYLPNDPNVTDDANHFENVVNNFNSALYKAWGKIKDLNRIYLETLKVGIKVSESDFANIEKTGFDRFISERNQFKTSFREWEILFDDSRFKKHLKEVYEKAVYKEKGDEEKLIDLEKSEKSFNLLYRPSLKQKADALAKASRELEEVTASWWNPISWVIQWLGQDATYNHKKAAENAAKIELQEIEDSEKYGCYKSIIKKQSAVKNDKYKSYLENVPFFPKTVIPWRRKADEDTDKHVENLRISHHDINTLKAIANQTIGNESLKYNHFANFFRTSPVVIFKKIIDELCLKPEELRVSADPAPAPVSIQDQPQDIDTTAAAQASASSLPPSAPPPPPTVGSPG